MPERDLIGRQREIEAATEALAETRAGRGALLLLTGEAGAGKTTLLDHMAATAEAAGMVVAWATAPDTEGTPPFWPWIEALRTLAGQIGNGALAAAPRALSEPATGGEAPDAARFRLFDQVAQSLAALGRPAVLLLDDLHRADGGTLRLLEFVAPRLRRLAVTLVVAARPPAGNDDVAATFGALVRAGARRLQLLPWSEAEVAVALAHRGVAADPDTVRRVRTMTNGNPFFVLELANEAGRARVPITALPAPPAVVDTLRAELRRVPPAALDLLRLAAVWGQDAPPSVLAAAAGMPADAVMTLAPAAFLEVGPAGALRFRHDLIREAVVESLRPHDRQRLHARLAEAVAAGQLPAAERTRRLAVHGCHAGAVWDVEAAFAAASIAAREASSRLGIETAAAFFTLADRVRPFLPEDAPRDRDFLLRFGELLTLAGERERATTVLDELVRLARRTGDAPALARAALLYGLGRETAGHAGPEADAVLAEALACLPEDEHALRARLLARTIWHQINTSSFTAETHRMARQCVAEARLAEDPVAIAHALSAYLVTAQDLEPADQRALAREMTDQARRAGDIDMMFGGLLWETGAALTAGDIPAARDGARRYEQLAGAYPLPYHLWYVPLMRAAFALLDHRLDEARRAIAELNPAATAQPEFAALMQMAQMFELAVRAGDQDLLDEAAGRILEAMASTWVFPALAAHVLALQGDHAGATAHLDRFIDSLAGGARDDDWLAGLVEAGLAACALGASAQAAALLDWLSPYAGRWSTIGSVGVCRGPVAGVLAGLAGLCGDAEGARHYQARARQEAAGTPGALFWMERCLPAGRMAAVPGPAGLSSREREVLALLAAGLGNQEIADRLVLSVRTVQRHVENIYAKTGARGRAAAAVFATTHGLVTPSVGISRQ